MRYAPDKDNPFPKPKPGGGNNNGANNLQQLPAFQPGQLAALSSQLNTGFGGGAGAWKESLRNTFDPTRVSNFNFGGSHHNGGGNNPGGKPDPRGPGGNPNGPGGGFNPSRPDHRMAPVMANPQMQMPQMGLLNSAPAINQQQGLLGDIPPEVLAFISARR